MRILILSNSGMGLFKFRTELIEALIDSSNEVYLSLPNDEYIKKLKKLGCIFIETKVDRRGTNPIADLKLLLSYLKNILKIKPDIVLTYTVKPNVYGGIACRITKIPYIANITGLGTAIENKGIIQKLTLTLYRVGLRNAKCVFFQNEPNRKLFSDQRIVKNNTKVIPGSGVNLDQYCFERYPEEKDNCRLLFIGRIMKAKGIDELLEAAEQITDSNKKVEFHLVGICEEEYSEKLIKLTDSKIIHYHGQQDDVHKYIKSSHATILPSYHEGTSNVLLESAATGRPVLASNVTGCKETFDEGISGIGFEAKSVDRLVEAILKFISYPYDKKKQMGKAGRIKMEQEYDRKIIINEYLEKIYMREEF